MAYSNTLLYCFAEKAFPDLWINEEVWSEDLNYMTAFEK
jgi:hypothetical protein